MKNKYYLSLIILFLFPSLANADVITPQGGIIECFCTDTYGQRHELGDIICLTVDSRTFLAKCVMAQNNPFWREQSQGCDSSNLFFPDEHKSLMTPITTANFTLIE